VRNSAYKEVWFRKGAMYRSTNKIVKVFWCVCVFIKFGTVRFREGGERGRFRSSSVQDADDFGSCPLWQMPSTSTLPYISLRHIWFRLLPTRWIVEILPILGIILLHWWFCLIFLSRI